MTNEQTGDDCTEIAAQMETFKGVWLEFAAQIETFKQGCMARVCSGSYQKRCRDSTGAECELSGVPQDAS